MPLAVAGLILGWQRIPTPLLLFVVLYPLSVILVFVIGLTTVIFEGALDYPTPDANWRIAVEELGVTGIFTSPTAVRAVIFTRLE